MKLEKAKQKLTIVSESDLTPKQKLKVLNKLKKVVEKAIARSEKINKVDGKLSDIAGTFLTIALCLIPFVGLTITGFTIGMELLSAVGGIASVFAAGVAVPLTSGSAAKKALLAEDLRKVLDGIDEQIALITNPGYEAGATV